MDNLAHTLCAAAIAKTKIGRATPLCTAALLVSANFPDIDIISSLWEKPAYLYYHRGITHSIFGIALQVVLLSAIFLGIEKLFYARQEQKRFASLAPISLAVLLGLTSHLLLDFLNSYGIRPWLPFSEDWIYGDLVFIVDPYLWLLFAAMAFLPQPRSKTGNVAFAIFLLGSEWIILSSSRAPFFLKIIYPLGLLALAWLRWGKSTSFSTKRIFVVSLTLIGVYLGSLLIFREIARVKATVIWNKENYRAEPIEKQMMNPQPAEAWNWDFTAQNREHIFRKSVSLDGTIFFKEVFPRNLDTESAIQALDSETGKRWLHFARFPFAILQENETGTLVHLLDARYQTLLPPGWSGITVHTDKKQ